MLSRRSLVTGLVSFLAAPAIVRASSLDVLRGVVMREAIDRQMFDVMLYGMGFARLKHEGEAIAYDHIDPAALWGDADVVGLRQWA